MRTIRVIADLLPAQEAALASLARVTVYAGGVGAGKSWTGAFWALLAPPGTRVLVVAPTYRVLRDGTLNTLKTIVPRCRINYQSMTVTFPNKTILYLRSAGNLDDTVRSVEVDRVWFEEGAYLNQSAITTAMGRLRASLDARILVTTTPRARAAVHKLWVEPWSQGEPDIEVHTSRSSDNPHLDPNTLAILRKTYGERLARQELDGEWIDVAGGLWAANEITITTPPGGKPHRAIVGVDPNAGGQAEVGIVCIGIWHAQDGSQRAWVLDDASGQYSAAEWPTVVTDLARKWNARVVAEVNNGGDMVERVLRATDRTIRFEAVRAIRDKASRAIPIAAMYRQGLVSHAATFGRLEAQMTGWDPTTSEISPDRMDALVWALTGAKLSATGQPQTSSGVSTHAGSSSHAPRSRSTGRRNRA